MMDAMQQHHATRVLYVQGPVNAIPEQARGCLRRGCFFAKWMLRKTSAEASGLRIGKTQQHRHGAQMNIDGMAEYENTKQNDRKHDQQSKKSAALARPDGWGCCGVGHYALNLQDDRHNQRPARGGFADEPLDI